MRAWILGAVLSLADWVGVLCQVLKIYFTSVDRGFGDFQGVGGLDRVLRGRREASRGWRLEGSVGGERQFGRCACGFTPAFGRAVTIRTAAHSRLGTEAIFFKVLLFRRLFLLPFLQRAGIHQEKVLEFLSAYEYRVP